MAPFRNGSILYGLDKNNGKSIRRVMRALIRRVAGVTAAASAGLANLQGPEHGIADRIFNTAAGNELLMNMVERFGSAHNADSSTILEVAEDFDRVATDAVQDPQTRPAHELIAARNNFDRLILSGRFIYCEDGVNEYSDFEPESDLEVDQPDEDIALPIRPDRRLVQVAGRKRTLTETAVNANNNESRGEDSNIKCEAEEVKGKYKSFKSNSLKKNTPIRPQGTRCIDDGSHDRDPAKVNSRDDSKLKMTFKLEENDPANPGRSIPAGIATYTYHRADEVDWTSKESVAKLNNWRQGNFIRQLGSKQKTRELWLESERDELIRILEQHLSTSMVRGQWRRIDWKFIEARYNSIMKGTKQDTGGLTAKRMYPHGQRQNATSESVPLKKARTAPIRSAQALRSQIEYFADDRARRMVQKAKEKDYEDLDEGADVDIQLKDEVSDCEVPDEEDDGPEPKRQRKDKGKEREVIEASASEKNGQSTDVEEKESGRDVEESVDERFERETHEAIENSRKRHDGSNGGPSSCSSASSQVTGSASSSFYGGSSSQS